MFFIPIPDRLMLDVALDVEKSEWNKSIVYSFGLVFDVD